MIFQERNRTDVSADMLYQTNPPTDESHIVKCNVLLKFMTAAQKITILITIYDLDIGGLTILFLNVLHV